MKTAADDLFTLIMSMDSKEKAFFKTNSVKGIDTRASLSYLKLFDIINSFKGKEYDDKLLKIKLERSGFSHSLRKAKEYLTRAILKSLTEYHSNTSENIQIRALLDQAEILIDKKLYKAAKSTLLKAEKLALEYENFGSLLEICKGRSIIAQITSNQTDLEYVIKEQIQYERKYSDLQRNNIEYKHLSDKIRYLHNESDNNHPAFKEIHNSPLLVSPKMALSYSAIKYYYNIHFQTWFLMRKNFDIKKALKRQMEWVAYLESDKQKLIKRCAEYLTELSNLLSIQSLYGGYKACEDLFNKANLFFNSLPSKRRTKALELRIFVLGINFMSSELRRGYPQKAIEGGMRIISIAYENPGRIALWDNLFIANFLMAKNQEALKYLNKIINFKEKFRPDIQVSARIYLLLVHYEMGHLELLPFLAKQAQRFLLKHNSYSEYEKIIIRFFEKEIYQCTNTKERIAACSNLKQQLELLLKKSHNVNSDEIDFISWLESKIENRPFVDIVREKTLQKSHF